MRYLSPASLPDPVVMDPPDKKALMLQRRKLLAELELSADETLLINNRSFSRNDILEFFETLQDETILRFHAAVAKDALLVEFLEAGQMPEDGHFLEAELYADAEFLQWISPYFYKAFTEYVIGCLQDGYAAGLWDLLQNPLLLTDYDLERAWMRTGEVLENNIARLEHYREQAGQAGAVPPIQQIESLAGDSYIELILLLPKESFAGIRDRYAVAILQVAIVVFNKRKENRDSADSWIQNAKRIAVSEDLRSELDDKIIKVNNIRDRGLPIGFAIMVFVIIKVLGSQGGCNSGNDVPKFSKFTVINGKDTVEIHSPQQLDSLRLSR